MANNWTADEVLALARSYQPACVLAAAADLGLFEVVGRERRTAEEVVAELGGDRRAVAMLLDALAALKLLHKKQERYSAPKSVVALLGREGPGSVLSMARHHANCLRRWARLAEVVQSGRPAEREPSIRGAAEDERSFIEAMHDVSAPVAAEVVRALKPLSFRRLLDVGGGSGTWTAALLEACPGSTAILFDLPEVLPLARSRMASLGMSERVMLVGGDYLNDPLPEGADLAWVSSIVHQNSRQQNLTLFVAAHRALVPGGRIAIRDLLMKPSRTSPLIGALFAINMLVNTEGGGTYTFDEIREDLEAAGFTEAKVQRRDEAMSSLVTAKKKS